MKNINTEVKIAGISFKNPVMSASGTFASGREFSEFMDLSKMGAVVTKGVSAVPWEGNDAPRICETPAGMLNAIGLQNPGVEAFIKNDLPFLSECGSRVIVNVCGHSVEEYVQVIEALNDAAAIDAFEVNISCPNVSKGGIAFGTDPKLAERVTKAVRDISKKPVIIKLSPNVTDITEIARAAESGGADALSLINTLLGMKIDINTRKFALANKTGGLSGPAIHPVAVRMVYQTTKAVSIPVIGVGGIIDYEGAIEMMMAGARAVMIGTANFTDPAICEKIVSDIQKYLSDNNIADINEIVGIV